ncbi:hypothetical protein BKA70DRAFT_1430344 [Coprinopsis sp. MPI-PUGE-AT-0042]|nr:hypothetical protein BKA70DRAFT_1430344 [Coprinopsis sp. MPI-PUGE-AT-0042]
MESLELTNLRPPLSRLTEVVEDPAATNVVRSTSAEKGPISARKLAQVNLRPVVSASASEPRAPSVNEELDRHAKRIFNAEGEMASICANLEGLKRDATWRATDRDKISALEDRIEQLEKDRASLKDLLTKAQGKIGDHETSLTEMRSSLALLSAFWLHNTSLPAPSSQNASLPPAPAVSANHMSQVVPSSNAPQCAGAANHHEGVAQPTHNAAGALVTSSINSSANYATRHAQQQDSLAPHVNQGHQATSINPSAVYEARHAQQQEPSVNQAANHPPPPDIGFQDLFLGEEIPTSADMSGWAQYIAGSSNRNVQQYPCGSSISMASAGRNSQLPYGSSTRSSSSGFRSSAPTMQDPYREETRTVHPNNLYPAPAASNTGPGDPSLYGLDIDPQSSNKHLPQSANIGYVNGVEQPNTSPRDEGGYHFGSGTVPNPRVPLGGMDTGPGGDGGRFTIGTTRAEGSGGNLTEFDDRAGGIHDEGAEPRLNMRNGYQSSPHSEPLPDVQSVPYALIAPTPLSNVRHEEDGYVSSPLSEPPSDIVPVSFNPLQQISNIRSRLRTCAQSKPPPPIRRRKNRT